MGKYQVLLENISSDPTAAMQGFCLIGKKGVRHLFLLLVASVHPWELSPHFFRWGSTERLVGTPQNAPFESLPEQQCHPEPFLQLPPGYLECVADQVVLEILRAPAHRRKVGDLQSLGWSYFLS